MIMTRYQVRQYPTSIRILLARIAKDIILLTVPMKIETGLYSKLLSRLLYLCLELPLYRWALDALRPRAGQVRSRIK